MKVKKILVVDFDASSRESLSEFLQAEGFQVIKAKDGQSGLEKFESEHPDLIILEPMVPKLHGFDLCKNIGKDSGKETPIIFITEFYGEDQCIREALQPSEIIAFFKKPYKKEDVLSSVHNFLGDKREKKPSPSKPEKPEKKTIPSEDIKDLLAADSAQKNKKKKAEQEGLPEEIDRLLQNTLSEFGLDIEKEKTAVPEKSKDQEKEKKKPPLHKKAEAMHERIEEAKEKPKKKEPIIPETPAAREAEPAMEEKQEDSSGPEPKFFTEYAEVSEGFSFKPVIEKILLKLKGLRKVRLKIPAPHIILPVVFVSLIAGGGAFYFLKPKKSDSPPRESASLIDSKSQKKKGQLQLAKLPSTAQGAAEENTGLPALDATGEKTQVRKTQEMPPAAEEEVPPAAKQEEKSSTATAAATIQKKAPALPPITEPITVDSAPYLKIQETTTQETEQPGVRKEENPSLSPEASMQKEQGQASPLEEEVLQEKIKTGDIVALSDVDTPPILIRRVPPKYPPLALAQGIEEKVLVNLLISENGQVIKTTIIRGEKASLGFNAASEEAVRQWRFKPAIKNGVKVKVWKPFLITFKKNK